MPAGWTNRVRGEGICPQGGPIRRGERASAPPRRGRRCAAPPGRGTPAPAARRHNNDQSDEGRGHMSAGWTNRTRREGICPQ
eukprot:51638-Prorocentrum_minimum.AAC.2